MRRILPALLSLLLLLCPACAFCAEGDPLLSVDDLLSLRGSFELFLFDVEDLAIEKGLLSPEERGAWHDAQMGDFFQNGGYGSILVNYTPGILSFVREEDTLLTLSAELAQGHVLEVSTMRRFTPEDSSLSGLMLTLGVIDADSAPIDARYALEATNGVFLKWDALLGAYVSVGTSASSDGETVVWSAQAPLPDALNPKITITVTNGQTGETLSSAVLELAVDGDGYLITEDALGSEE